MNTNSMNLVNFSTDIASDYNQQEKKSTGKALDPATIITIVQCIITLVTFIVGLFKQNNPNPTPTPTALRSYASDMNFIEKAFLKNRLNRYMNKSATPDQLKVYNIHKVGIVSNILSKLGSGDDKTLSGVLAEVLVN